MVWEKLVKFSEEREATLVFGTKTVVEGGWYNTSLAMRGGEVLGTHYKNYPVHFFRDGIAGTDAEAVKSGGFFLGA